MSYDFSMHYPKCERCGQVSSTDLDMNYTYNVGKMFRRALADTDVDGGIYGIDGMTGEAVLDALTKALEYFDANRESLYELEPENGWGDYNGARRVLSVLHRYATDHPKAVFRVS